METKSASVKISVIWRTIINWTDYSEDAAAKLAVTQTVHSKQKQAMAAIPYITNKVMKAKYINTGAQQ